MRRFFLAAIGVAAFIGFSAVPAQAYTRINANCILRAYTPNTGERFNGQFAGQGEVDCNSAPGITLAVCLQQLVSGGWSNVYCNQGSSSNNTFSVQTYGVYPYSGRWYRTEDQGWASGSYAQYFSSGVQG